MHNANRNYSIIAVISNSNCSHARLPFIFCLLQHIANHQQIANYSFRIQATLNYSHYCNSPMLTRFNALNLTLDSQLLFLIIQSRLSNFLWCDPVTHMTQNKVILWPVYVNEFAKNYSFGHTVFSHKFWFQRLKWL